MWKPRSRSGWSSASRRVTAVALLGLLSLIAGCPSGGGKKRAETGGPAPDSADVVLATVAGTNLTASDVRAFMARSSDPARLDSYMRNPDILHVALSAMVDQFVWANVARKAGYKLTRGEEVQVAALESELLATRYVADAVDKKAQPTSDEVKAYYDSHMEQYMQESRVAVRHILVDGKAEAERLRREAEGGADFTALVRAHSRDAETRDMGGALGYVTAHGDILGLGHNEAFARAVLVLEPGQVTVLQTDKGWHVVKVERKEGGKPRPLDEVKEEIAAILKRERFSGVYNAQLADAREAVGVNINRAGLERMTGVSNNCERILQMAEEHPDPTGRVELYRRVAIDFPDCEQAAYAQFMVGYLMLTKLKTPEMANKALLRLRKNYAGSPWRKAGDYLLDHLGEDPEKLGSPEDVRNKAKG